MVLPKIGFSDFPMDFIVFSWLRGMMPRMVIRARI